MDLLIIWSLFAAFSFFIFHVGGLLYKKTPRNYKKMTEQQLVDALKGEYGVDTRISGLKNTKLVLLKLLDKR